jgi:hypothetical protein
MADPDNRVAVDGPAFVRQARRALEARGGCVSSSYDSAVIDTAMIEDPRLLEVDRGTRLMHLEAIVWSKAHLTDGRIPSGALRRLTDEEEPREAAAVLCRVGVWEAVPSGWQILGFTDTQMSAARVRELRVSARERYDNWKNKRVSNGAANGPARPPAPPARKGGGQRGGRTDGSTLEGEPPQECGSCGLFFFDRATHECDPALVSGASA